MQLKLSELLLDCNTVGMSGEVSYERPVLDELLCVCRLPSDSEKVFEALVRDGAVSTTLTSMHGTLSSTSTSTFTIATAASSAFVIHRVSRMPRPP